MQSIYGFIRDAVTSRGWAVVVCSDLTDFQARTVAEEWDLRVDIVHLPVGRCFRFEGLGGES